MKTSPWSFLRPMRLLALIALCAFINPSETGAAETNKNTLITPPRRAVPGQRFTLKLGSLYQPDFFRPATNGAADLVLFFHGADWCAEQNFYDAKKNAVLVTVNKLNLDKIFAKPADLSALLEETVKALAPEDVTSIRHICLASFSGGYVAIREILRQPEHLDRITDVVLADSLYAPRAAGKTNELDANSMAPFLEYAKRASEGKCTFWFSQLYPPEEKYRNNTTTLAAYYLTDKLGVERKAATGTNSQTAKLLYRAEKKNFHILGYSGMTTQDHFNHFYALSDLLREISFESVTKLQTK